MRLPISHILASVSERRYGIRSDLIKVLPQPRASYPKANHVHCQCHSRLFERKNDWSNTPRSLLSSKLGFAHGNSCWTWVFNKNYIENLHWSNALLISFSVIKHSCNSIAQYKLIFYWYIHIYYSALCNVSHIKVCGTWAYSRNYNCF